MGKWTGNIPEFFSLYERVGSDIYLPFGCAKEVYLRFGQDMCFKADFSPLRRIDYKSNINPYPYQEAAIKASQAVKNGIVVMPCGAGKTQTALEIIARIGGRALWLTHTQDLLNQSLNRAKSTLGIFSGNYGTITSGKVNIGQGITFATVQTMVKIDLAQYRDAWDIIIVDECHKAVGSPTKMMQFYKVLSSLSCRYKIGLTATPKRADGMEKSMFALLGGVIHEVTREEVADTTCSVKVVHVQTDYTPDTEAVLAGDGTLNYSALIDDMVHNDKRFFLIAECVLSCADKGAILVLANRVEYLERIHEWLSAVGKRSICLSKMGTGKAAKEIRKSGLKALNSGELDCVFATYQLAKEGLDVPNLRYVVFATPEKDETTVMQAAGRVGRKSDGKECGIVLDFVDNFGMFKGWAKKRNGYYKKLGYEILS
jgi:superfamily II DNA or RNA helicase